MHNTLLIALDRRDRALFLRCVDHARARRAWRLVWTMLTHLGGATMTIAAALIPLWFGGPEFHATGERAFATLVLSHVAVQILKRSINRPRPSRRGEPWMALVREPDRFSFPSGHSAAAMAVAFSYALAFPALAIPLVVIAALVGASRIFLGVHYPGDVVIGQLLAIATALLV